MCSLFLKEVAGFYSTLTGYLVILIFVTGAGLLMWVLPGEMNILDGGVASIGPLFIIAPWLFLFLVPAVTMRMFSEEKRSGSLELLFSYPVSDQGIVLAKFFAAVTLVLSAILPCLLFYLSVYLLGNPRGNIDAGGTWGSFIGLFFLASSYAGAGLLATAITDNPVVAFILAIILCFFLLFGFDMLASLPFLKSQATFLLPLGINEHYQSMSRGVIGSADLVYFMALISIFLVVTTEILHSKRR